MMHIKLIDHAGEFGGDKDVARDLRERLIRPALAEHHAVVLDFDGVDLVTQSFVHALVSDLIRSEKFDALDLLTFENCSPSVRELIEIVVDYSQEDVVAEA